MEERELLTENTETDTGSAAETKDQADAVNGDTGASDNIPAVSESPDNAERRERELELQISELRYEMIRLRRELKSFSRALQTVPASSAVSSPEPVKPTKKRSYFKDIIFYLLLAALIIGAFVMRSGADGKPVMLAGFSAFTVKTSSMEDVIPKGSFVLTRTTDADELVVGDDITFMVNETTSVTHRIIRIIENYLDSGERAFITQGTMNAEPDKNPVQEVNVVGKVIFHNKLIGDAFIFAKANWPLLLFIAVVLTALIIVLKFTMSSDSPDEKNGKRSRRRRKKKLR